MPTPARCRQLGLMACLLASLVTLAGLLSMPPQVLLQAADAADLPVGIELTMPGFPADLKGESRRLNEELSKGVLPQDNAAVWLVQIYGEDAFDAELKEATLKMLGIAKLSPASPLFVPLGAFVEELDDVPPEEVALHGAMLQEHLSSGAGEFWKKEQWPKLQGYLAANQAALDTLTEAANRPRYFAPLLAIETPQRLMSASLVIERRLPYLAKMLCARALMRFQDQDVTGCISDLMTCHKIARLLADGSPFDVSVAKAQVINSYAFQAESTILENGRLNVEQIAKFQNAFAGLSSLPAIAIAADIGERAILRQEIELLRIDPDSAKGFFESDDHTVDNPANIKSLAKSNWKQTLQRAEAVQDRFVAALKTRDRAAQEALFVKLDADYAAWEASADELTDEFSKKLEADPASMSAWVGESMAMSLKPAYRQRRNAEDRAIMRHDMIVFGLALEACQRKTGEFPETLADLSPDFLPKVPVDPCSGKPYVYKRHAPDRVSLISWGNNLQDDAGQNFNDDLELKLK